MSAQDKTCKDRVQENFESRMEDLRLLWAGYCEDDCPECDGIGEYFDGCEWSENEKCQDPDCTHKHKMVACPLCDGEGKLTENVKDLGTLYEYGLSFDYVAPHTFNDQREGYFRYQISWGGPSDEFRIYAQKISEYQFSVYKIEYWFLDWFDGAHVLLTGEDEKFIDELFSSFFVDSGSADNVLQKAMEDYEPEYNEDEED